MLTEHGVALDASFSKYGYSAHLRTYDQNPYTGCSMVVAEEPESHHDRRQSDFAIRDDKTATKFFKQPIIRQYFHKGLLWRASGLEEVGSFELVILNYCYLQLNPLRYHQFVDLLYVGIISTLGERASENPDGQHMLHFIILFILSWKLWNDLMLLISWFETGKHRALLATALILIDDWQMIFSNGFTCS